ncbi:MAG: SH3 domain-containing protein [Omnitrophica WOR_2 bacterium]
MFTKKYFSIYVLTSLIILVSLAACSPAAQPDPAVSPIQNTVSLPGDNPLPDTGVVFTPTLPAAPTPSVVDTATVTPTIAANPAPTPAASPVIENPATVAVSSLKLRLGPGFGYSTLKLLEKDQVVSLLGRSENNLWALVKLSDGSEGWVFGVYLLSDMNIASLPLKEARGGPNSPVPAQPVTYSLVASIEDNMATVDVENYPASQKIIARLGLPGERPSLVVASGKTGADGNAQLTFTMPNHWEDGTKINQSELVLEVSTADGSYSHEISLVYFK